MMKFLSILLMGTVLSVCVGQEGKLADDPKASNVESALEDQILHLGLRTEPRSIDPHLASSMAARNVLIALLEGLVSDEPDMPILRFVEILEKAHWRSKTAGPWLMQLLWFLACRLESLLSLLDCHGK